MSVQFVLFTLFRAAFEGKDKRGKGSDGQTKGNEARKDGKGGISEVEEERNGW